MTLIFSFVFQIPNKARNCVFFSFSTSRNLSNQTILTITLINQISPVHLVSTSNNKAVNGPPDTAHL